MDLRPSLSAVRCPVLVLVGEQDPLVPPSNAEEAVVAIPDSLATPHRVANAGHQVLWDAPNIVEDLLRPFVGRCAKRAEAGPDTCGLARALSVRRTVVAGRCLRWTFPLREAARATWRKVLCRVVRNALDACSPRAAG